MGPQDYMPKFTSPIQAVMAAKAAKNEREAQQQQIGLQARRLDLSEQQAANQQSNADRSFGFQTQQADQTQQNIDRDFGYRAEQDAIRMESEAAKAAEQQQQKQAMADFAAKPNKTADDYSEMMIKFPDIASSIKSSHDLKSQPQQKEALQQATQVYSALSAGAPDVAIQMLETRKQAANNSGDKAAYDGADGMIKIIKASPENAMTSAGMYLAATVDGNDFAYTLGALDKTLPGNTAQDTKRLAEAARASGIPQKDINRVLRETRGEDFESRMRKLNAAKKQPEAKTGNNRKERKTSSTEMNSMFSYGKALGLTKQQVNQAAKNTLGMPIEDRFNAIDAMAKSSGATSGDDMDDNAEDFDTKYGDKKQTKPAEKQSGPTPEFLKANEGKVFNTPNGKVKIVNGKPQKVE